MLFPGVVFGSKLIVSNGSNTKQIILKKSTRAYVKNLQSLCRYAAPVFVAQWKLFLDRLSLERTFEDFQISAVNEGNFYVTAGR